MKIIALADHSHDPSKFNKMLNKNKIDFILLLGDLKYIDLLALRDISIPIFGIYGNHCKSDYLNDLKAKNVHNKIEYFNDIKITGLKGCPLYKGGQNELSQEQASQILDRQEYADILTTHSPATGINNSSHEPHQGFKAIKDYINKHNPILYFHGHSYPPIKQKISVYNNTLCYFVEGLELIDLEELDRNFKTYPKAKSY